MRVLRPIVWGQSPLPDVTRALAASIEAEGYTLRKLRNMEPEKRRALVERHMQALDGVKEALYGNGGVKR